jgi:predicted phage terminase large subunit-like protein
VRLNPSLKKAVVPRLNRYILHCPTPKQAAFLLLDCEEAFFGGAAGGGKSDALLMSALQYVDVPGYAALLLRRSYEDLALPGALIPRAYELLAPTGAKWNEQKKHWIFPHSKSVLQFGYLAHEKDKYRYRSSEFQFIGWDELTQFSETQYTYVSFTRKRKRADSKVPTRIRSASNPGDTGHEWVKRRFLTEGMQHGRIFIPSKVDDNPYIDKDDYVKSLSNLDPVTREQYLSGDWEIREGGGMFKREWFQIVDEAPAGLRWVRYWDKASTKKKPGKEPDFTVGEKMARTQNGIYYIAEVLRFRGNELDNELIIRQTAERDGKETLIFMEEEPGSEGKSLIDVYTRTILSGYAFRGVRSTGSKATRAAPFSSQCEAGNVKLVKGPWITAYLEELEVFDGSGRFHDDQVDASSGAFHQVVPQYAEIGLFG